MGCMESCVYNCIYYILQCYSLNSAKIVSLVGFWGLRNYLVESDLVKNDLGAIQNSCERFGFNVPSAELM